MDFSRQEYWSGLPFPSPSFFFFSLSLFFFFWHLSFLVFSKLLEGLVSDISLRKFVSLFILLVFPLQELPWWLRSKESACHFRRCGFDPWVGMISWRRKWLPTPVFLPGEFHGQFHGQRSLTGYYPWGRKELDMTYQLNNKKFPLHDILYLL